MYDVDEGRIAEAVNRHGATIAPVGRVHAAEAHVYAPCALRATLNPDTVSEIRAAVNAGAANNQLSDRDQDLRLWQRGITYCPDYIVNAGGVLSVAHKGTAYDHDRALKRVARIRRTTAAVLELAQAEGIPTGAAADRLVSCRLGTRGNG